jgi:hypothetical protein
MNSVAESFASSGDEKRDSTDFFVEAPVRPRKELRQSKMMSFNDPDQIRKSFATQNEMFVL